MQRNPRPPVTARTLIHMMFFSQNYQSFHRLSGDQDREARLSAYHKLINLMLSQMTEDKQLINVSAAHPKSNGPFHSNLETQPELKKKQDKLLLQWPPIQETQRVVDVTLGLYQHGQQPKSGSSSSQWPTPTVKNSWDKEFSPKDFPTTHKIPSILPATDAKASNLYGCRPSP